MKFKNKVVLITGGSRGIGAAIAHKFAEEGANLIINYHSEAEKAQMVCNHAIELGADALSVKADISNSDDVKRMVKETIDYFGQIDVLINNAGWAQKQSLIEINPKDLNRQLQVNIAGMVYCTQAIAAIMEDYGRVINITSLAAKGGAAFPVYSATKAAGNALTKSFAEELGHRNITVNAVAPAAVETDLYRSVGLDQFKESSLAASALGFLGDVNDVADAVLFFASEQSRWITGEILYVTGGRNM